MKKIIQVGVGGMGEGWTDCVAASKHWEAAAYVDTNQDALLGAAARHGMPRRRCFASLEKALGMVEADAVLDVTPQKSRKKICLTALAQGVPVLSEKPLAPTIGDALAIIAMAKKQGCTYMVAQNYRYQALMQSARKCITRGMLGDVAYVGLNFHKGPRFGGFRETMAYPLILDMAIHHIDLLRFLFDRDISQVQGASVKTPWNWNKGDATVMAQLEMSKGLVVNYFASWVSQGYETTWNGDWRIEGSKGLLILEGDQLFFSDKAGSRRKVPLMKFPIKQQAWLLDHLHRCLDQGAEPETSGRRNLNSLATTHALVRAVKERRRVAIKELLKPK